MATAIEASAQAGKNDSAAARYEADRAACALIAEPESRSACLREAAAARAEVRSGQLPEGRNDEYQRNALARCQALPTTDQELCRRRTLGEGTVSGSVSGGGIYREYREITVPDASPVSEALAK
ncbi:hypothetical protein [Noviherbaspirillum aerium]|uniref:hypothetical protein n=1 Tax=Noviherbaspirillum aerium TaxID=2588497 RepID=UPI00124C351F|nr:hypothetical protein [Noviherbaspirillum aerium]